MQMCTFIRMLCIFCLLSLFTWMSNRPWPESSNVYLLWACLTQDSSLLVAPSSWNPLFLTHTFNPLANFVDSFFKIHPNLGTFHRALPRSSSKPQLFSRSPQALIAVSPLQPGPPTVYSLKAARNGCFWHKGSIYHPATNNYKTSQNI